MVAIERFIMKWHLNEMCRIQLSSPVYRLNDAVHRFFIYIRGTPM